MQTEHVTQVMPLTSRPADEASCSCGWSETTPSVSSAQAARERHLTEVAGDKLSMAIATLRTGESTPINERARVKRVNGRTFVLLMDRCDRARWGTFAEIEQDALYVLRTGMLPPVIDRPW